MTGKVSREHWIVPVCGLTQADPDGLVQAIAHPDGTVNLHLTCGDSQVMVRLDISRAAQISTGIWEAAGVAQQLTGHLGELPPQPPHVPEDQPAIWRSHPHRKALPRDRSPRTRRRPARVNNDATRDIKRTIGWRIQRIRNAQKKSLRVIAGLAGMGRSTLHRIEHGQRDVTLSEIVALADALQIAPSTLISLPILVPGNGHTDTATKALRPAPREAG
ncbi:MAG: helix-turn-helix domain-containing protein [Pseudonocardiales bacterium]